MPLTLHSDPDAPEADKDVIRDGLNQMNVRITGRRDYNPVAIFVRDESGALRGGVLGAAWAGWLHIEYLWIEDSWQGQGYGEQLLRAAEAEARAHGCQHVVLETFDFQAPEFYRKQGYAVFAELAERPAGHTYYYLRKAL